MNNFFYFFFEIPREIKIRFYLFYNRLRFKMIGIDFGRNLRVFNKVYVHGRGKVKIGNDFLFTSGDCINPICRNLCGSIYTMTPDARIIIGDRVGISSACLWAKEKITIGNDVNIGGDCLIIDNDAHPHEYSKRRYSFIEEIGVNDYYKTIPTAPVVIGDDVWIGAKCQILKGVHIGKRSVIAAGSIVNKSIPEDCVAGGNPAKIIKYLK